MKFLLTNDDGIDAAGIAALERAFSPLGEVYVVAPDAMLSGCSHQVTVDRPLELKEQGPNRYSLDGTPADCVRVGLLHLGLDVDWVLSGINHGGNLGVDVFMSGTIAAVREGALIGKPGIAFSNFRNGERQFNWQAAEEVAQQIGKLLFEKPLDKECFWNVNLPDSEHLPHSPGHRFAPLDTNAFPSKYEARDGKLHYQHSEYVKRKRNENSDVDVCFSGDVSISLVNLQTKNAGPQL